MRNDALAREMEKFINSPEHLDPDLEKIPKRLHQEYFLRKQLNDRFNWWAKGQMQIVEDVLVTDMLITIKDLTFITASHLIVVPRKGIDVIVHAGQTDAYGLVLPFNEGRFFAAPKEPDWHS